MAGICRTRYLSKWSCAHWNILNATELLCMFYHNKKKILLQKERKKKEIVQRLGKVTKSLPWELTLSP